ncbi:uncharacterized protein LOC143435438 isoform X2 [Arvicanthis niloticus]|uniref:uncharacterized protein LOC143309784 isoform X2 n=1 Tax=Arvicanthis niloticus TaxID=61156 RepID=UPI00402BABA0
MGQNLFLRYMKYCASELFRNPDNDKKSGGDPVTSVKIENGLRGIPCQPQIRISTPIPGGERVPLVRTRLGNRTAGDPRDHFPDPSIWPLACFAEVVRASGFRPVSF